MRLLIVEDEKQLNEILTRQFTKEGYSVDSCENGEEALLYLGNAAYDAVVMDVMMPKLDGFEVLRRMRAQKNTTPVLLLTARGHVDDRVYGLDCGANDYLTKPFEFRELAARVRSMLRSASTVRSNDFEIADLRVNLLTKTVTRNDVPVDLSAREYAILECLVRNAGNVVSREQIENSVWNYDYSGGTNVVDVYIRYLRKKIDDGHDLKLIHTVRGFGYVLRADG